MKMPSLRSRRNGEPLSPLIDVVFLLLVFFMLIGTLTPPEPLPINPPQSLGGTTADNGQLVILVAADGRIAFENREIELSKLPTLLKPRLSSISTVAIKADATVATGTVFRILNELRKVGIDHIALLTVVAEA